MQALATALVVLLVLLLGCDSGADRNASPNTLDRGQEERSVREKSVTREGDRIAERTSPVESGRRMPREEKSLVLTFLLSWWWWLAYYAVGVLVGVIVYRDAKSRQRLAMNIRPIWWFLITVFDAPLGLLAYWLMNYSNLASKPASEESKPDNSV